MLKTCYGFCSLRTGVKIIAIYELICTILFFLSVLVYQIFCEMYPFNDNVNVYYFLQSCIIIITLLKILANVSLIQATYENAPYKIFLWIVITCIVYLIGFVVSMKMYIDKVRIDMLVTKTTESDRLQHHLLFAFILINFLSLIEIHIVASYYKIEKHLEELEIYTRIQNNLSLKKHGVKIFDIDILNSTIRPMDHKPLFSSFKCAPIQHNFHV